MRFLVLAYMWISWHSHAAAAPYDDQYQIFPVELDAQFIKSKRVRFALPCGAAYAGIVIIPGEKSWQVGAAARLNRIQCARFPEVRTEVLPRLRIDRSLSYSSVPRSIMKAKAPSRFVADWRILKRPTNRVIELVHEDSCGQNGLLLGPGTDGIVKLAMLDVREADEGACPYRQRTSIVDFVNMGDREAVSVIHGESNSLPLEQRYDLRLVPVRPGSARNHPGRWGASLEYLSKCNENPIGIVTRATKRDASGGPTAVGVGLLVARFYNIRCENQRPSWRRFRSRFLRLPDASQISYLSASRGTVFDGLTIRLPKEYKVLGPDAGLRLKFYSGCRDEIGWVHAPDAYGNYSVALLTKRRSALCAKRATVVSREQPWFDLKAVGHKVFPLRLSGFYYLQ